MKRHLKMVIPQSLLKAVVPRLPFSWRYGLTYTQKQKEIRKQESAGTEELKAFAFSKMKKIAQYAFEHIPFYNDFYRAGNFHPGQLHDFIDLQRIPIVTKADLKRVPLEKRSCKLPGSRTGNTGGTSGEPFSFLLDKNADAREWAHMHTIWQKLNYDPRLVKLSLRGGNFGSKTLIYCAGQNEYALNIYLPPVEQFQAVQKLLTHQSIFYLHGYPSAIYEFIRSAANQTPSLIDALRKHLKGVFLGSEYPAPVYRSLIEETLQVPTVSWYGHSEMAVLAYEKDEPYVYHPFPSYGFCEAVPTDNDTCKLVATSYDNMAAPFIRYDTGDTIRVEDETDGFLKSFSIAEGRVGEFILDRNQNPITLTALIFGRHHRVFNRASFIQISQNQPGKAIVWITMDAKKLPAELNWKDEFDGTNIAIDFEFKIIQEPLRTSSGKVPLLAVNSDQ